MLRNLKRLAPVLALLFLLGPAGLAGAQEERCFSETGQCLSGEFAAFWEQNGALPVFGLPISAAANERNGDSAQAFRSQWFERNRFELHPENSAPYDVLLGRLGADRLQQLGVNWRALPRESGPRDGCLWFDQTGHNVCDQAASAGFRSYWQTHGLRDARLDAYGRSLALFGLPLTEPRMEQNASGDRVLTQWFERARMEWHPQKPPQYRVLLGLIGVDVRGGMDPPSPNPVAKNRWLSIAAANAGPPARADHTAIVDPVRQQLVVFGGRDSGALGDTWIYELGSRRWREVAGAGPKPRFGHGAVYDAAGRRMIVLMGEGAGFFNDVWAFDLDREQWAQLKSNNNGPDAPRTRYGQSAALDNRGRVLISHGFSDQGRFDDTWAFDLATARWINLTPASGSRPLKRCLHELIYDAVGDRLVMFGGCASGFGPCPLGDLWAFDLKANRWAELKPSGATPSPRSNPSMVYNPATRQIFLFGGLAGQASAETWSYDLANNRWSRLESPGDPAARSSQALGYDAMTKRVVLFGGRAAAGARNDLWEWNF